MLFHTWYFLFFFLVVYLVYLPLRRTRAYLYWLLAASYLFYGWWNPLYLVLIAYSTAVNYYAVAFMQKGRRKKLWLVVSLVNSLGVLAFFKYSIFVADNLSGLLALLGWPFRIPRPGILLPVGISFYTFQSLSYSIDYYRGHIAREPSFVRFATFVALFPQLVAGPVERAKNLLPQLKGTPRITKEDIGDGLSLFVVGLFKKIALADYLAMYVDQIYAAPALSDSLSLMLATFAFGWQIYFDFSGYTDMARGIGRMLGFRFMLNFNNPYLATGLGDFWGRWQISLSTWFKDYVYIPLGGNRGGKFNTYRNMFATMVVSGLWHGAAWGFVVWGALHAVGRCLTRRLEGTTFYRVKVPKVVKQLAVFAFVTFAWIFFRAETFSDAVLIIKKIFACDFRDPQFPLLALVLCFSVWAYQFLYESKARRFLASRPVRICTVLGILLYLALFGGASGKPFVYFQF